MTERINFDYIDCWSFKVIITIIVFLLVMLIILLMVQVFLSRKVASKEERLSPLESGFESIISLMSVRAPFFFLAVLFVLFDLELILFFPGVVSISEEVVIIFV